MFEQMDFSREIESMREAVVRAKIRKEMFCEFRRMSKKMKEEDEWLKMTSTELGEICGKIAVMLIAAYVGYRLYDRDKVVKIEVKK